MLGFLYETRPRCCQPCFLTRSRFALVLCSFTLITGIALLTCWLRRSPISFRDAGITVEERPFKGRVQVSSVKAFRPCATGLKARSYFRCQRGADICETSSSALGFHA